MSKMLNLKSNSEENFSLSNAEHKVEFLKKVLNINELSKKNVKKHHFFLT